VPTPFAIGHVNAYLLPGDPLTMIDGGPNLATSLAAIERMLAGLGHAVADLELIVITHQHADHVGLAGLLAERSGAEVACLGVTADFIEEFPARQAAENGSAQELMRRHGIESPVTDALRSVADIVAGLGASVPVTRRLAPGDDLRMGGRTFRVEHRPGHSPTDTTFHEAGTGVLITGDHLLSRISSNALVTHAPDGQRTRPLLDYRRSLTATRETAATVGLGGHGPPIPHVAPPVGRRFDEQRRRADQIVRALSGGEAKTAHEIATALWGRVAFTQAFLTLSEILGHLDLLIEEGTAAADESGDVVRYSLSA
jgi:glyoxylase-like metal-dependent hydrolase (beta-lactamase superfamily II)